MYQIISISRSIYGSNPVELYEFLKRVYDIDAENYDAIFVSYREANQKRLKKEIEKIRTAAHAGHGKLIVYNSQDLLNNEELYNEITQNAVRNNNVQIHFVIFDEEISNARLDK